MCPEKDKKNNSKIKWQMNLELKDCQQNISKPNPTLYEKNYTPWHIRHPRMHSGLTSKNQLN